MTTATARVDSELKDAVTTASTNGDIEMPPALVGRCYARERMGCKARYVQLVVAARWRKSIEDTTQAEQLLKGAQKERAGILAIDKLMEKESEAAQRAYAAALATLEARSAEGVDDAAVD